MSPDLVGLAWRPELAADIHLHLEHIDLLEIIADNYFCAERNERAVLRSIARERPTTLHGVGMGLASASPVERKRVDAMARLVDAVQPNGWSEHLAFVRAGGIEIGHLAAPPRTRETIDGALANIQLAARVVGMAPALENVATLIDPPTSTYDEPRWTRSIICEGGTSLLLDLHNLYANALNFGRDPLDLLAAMPLESVRCVHLSGGKWITAPSGAERLLDDHLHAPPRGVYALLTELATRVSHPLEVIIERDGEYPPIQELLDQIRLARQALSAGRMRRTAVALEIAA